MIEVENFSPALFLWFRSGHFAADIERADSAAELALHG
jgi:hypothetical protein